MTATLALPETPEAMMDRFEEKFSAMASQEVFEAIRKGLIYTVERWIEIAVAIRTLEERGECMDLVRDAMSEDLIDWLKRIASGNLRAELICRYWRNASAIELLGKLPSSDQVRLINGTRVPVMVPDGAGGYTVRMKTFDEMNWRTEAPQVFDKNKGRIRTEAEQLSYIDAQRSKAALPKPERIGLFRIDREAELCYFAGKRGDTVDPKMLRAVLRALEGK